MRRSRLAGGRNDILLFLSFFHCIPVDHMGTKLFRFRITDGFSGVGNKKTNSLDRGDGFSCRPSDTLIKLGLVHSVFLRTVWVGNEKCLQQPARCWPLKALNNWDSMIGLATRERQPVMVEPFEFSFESFTALLKGTKNRTSNGREIRGPAPKLTWFYVGTSLDLDVAECSKIDLL